MVSEGAVSAEPKDRVPASPVMWARMPIYPRPLRPCCPVSLFAKRCLASQTVGLHVCCAVLLHVLL